MFNPCLYEIAGLRFQHAIENRFLAVRPPITIYLQLKDGYLEASVCQTSIGKGRHPEVMWSAEYYHQGPQHDISPGVQALAHARGEYVYDSVEDAFDVLKKDVEEHLLELFSGYARWIDWAGV